MKDAERIDAAKQEVTFHRSPTKYILNQFETIFSFIVTAHLLRKSELCQSANNQNFMFFSVAIGDLMKICHAVIFRVDGWRLYQTMEVGKVLKLTSSITPVQQTFYKCK